ncbi:hypothetical protein [Nocardia wallacei]|nr:hypothetical protein [Nocardia wallacei]
MKAEALDEAAALAAETGQAARAQIEAQHSGGLLYTKDAADECLHV